MIPRERVHITLEHEEPDRVPLDLGGIVTGIHKIAYEKLKNYFGLKTETLIFHKSQQLAKIEENILEKFNIDTRYVYFTIDPYSKILNEKYSIDMWGVKRVKTQYYYDISSDGIPLKNINSLGDLEKYNWPDPEKIIEANIDIIEKNSKYFHNKTNYAIVYHSGASIFERSWMLRGFNEFIIDLIKNPKFACKIMDIIMDFYEKILNETLIIIGKYIDIVTITDDLSFQQGPIIPIDIYRKYIKPKHKKLIETIKSKANVKIFIHCCGSASYFYEDFIDIGIDIVNPVQVSAKNMDTKILKEKYGNKLCFWGAIDTQKVLPFGSIKDVEKEVKKRISDLAPEGGYILAPVHNIQADVPPENIIKMYEIAKKYGKYPIKTIF